MRVSKTYARKKTHDNFWLYLLPIGIFLLGIFLILDDLVFHWMGDLSWVDGGNEFLNHWMVGVACVVFSVIILYRMMKRGVIL